VTAEFGNRHFRSVSIASAAFEVRKEVEKHLSIVRFELGTSGINKEKSTVSLGERALYRSRIYVKTEIMLRKYYVGMRSTRPAKRYCAVFLTDSGAIVPRNPTCMAPSHSRPYHTTSGHWCSHDVRSHCGQAACRKRPEC